MSYQATRGSVYDYFAGVVTFLDRVLHHSAFAILLLFPRLWTGLRRGDFARVGACQGGCQALLDAR